MIVIQRKEYQIYLSDIRNKKIVLNTKSYHIISRFSRGEMVCQSIIKLNLSHIFYSKEAYIAQKMQLIASTTKYTYISIQ